MVHYRYLALLAGSLLAVGCWEDDPVEVTRLSSSAAAVAEPLASTAGSGAAVDRVRVTWDLTIEGAPAMGVRDHFVFDLDNFEDGMTLRMADAPFGADPRALPPDLAGAVRPIGSGSLSPTEGARLFDPSGAPIEFDAELRERLRKEVGLPPVSVAVPPGRGRAAPPQPRHGRLVTPAFSLGERTFLRGRADSEVRLSPSRVRYTWSEEGAEHTSIFDEEIGAVVERVVARPDRPTLRITNDYDPVADGHVLRRSVTEWLNPGRSVIRRNVKTYVAR